MSILSERRIAILDYFNKETNKFEVRIHEDDGFCSRCYNIELTEDEYFNNTMTNKYGYTFLKYNGKKYLKHPMNGSYDEIFSQKQIDRAFNPERYRIEEWLNE